MVSSGTKCTYDLHCVAPLVTWFYGVGSIKAALYSSASLPCMEPCKGHGEDVRTQLCPRGLLLFGRHLDGRSAQRVKPCPRPGHQSLLRLEKKGKHQGFLRDRSRRAGSGKEG